MAEPVTLTLPPAQLDVIRQALAIFSANSHIRARFCSDLVQRDHMIALATVAEQLLDQLPAPAWSVV